MLTWIPEPSQLESPAEAFMLSSLGAVALPSAWVDSGCGSGPRVRWLADGSIEIEGEGVPTKALPKAVLQWRAQIQASAAKWGVPPQWVAGEMAAESGGQQNVHSYCCYGLMGLLPATASSQAGRTVGSAELLSDPALNIDLGTKLLGSLFKKYGGNPIRIPAAYNAGSPKCGAGKCAQPNRWRLVADCVNGVAVDYSGRVIAYSNGALAAGIAGGTSGGFAGTGWAWWQLGLGALAVGAIGLAVFRPAVLRGAVGALRENPKPEGHKTYWVYAYWKEGYEFDTHARLDDAKKAFREYVKRAPESAFIFHGDADGAFTNLDPVTSYYEELKENPEGPYRKRPPLHRNVVTVREVTEGWLLDWGGGSTELHESAVNALAAIKQRDAAMSNAGINMITTINWYPVSAIGRAVVKSLGR